MRLASTQLRVQLGHRPCGWKISNTSMDQSLESLECPRSPLPCAEKDKKKFKVCFRFLQPLLVSIGLSGISAATVCTTFAWHPSDRQGSITYTRARFSNESWLY